MGIYLQNTNCSKERKNHGYIYISRIPTVQRKERTMGIYISREYQLLKGKKEPWVCISRQWEQWVYLRTRSCLQRPDSTCCWLWLMMKRAGVCFTMRRRQIMKEREKEKGQQKHDGFPPFLTSHLFRSTALRAACRCCCGGKCSR